MRDNYGVTSEARWVTPAAGPQLVRWGSVFAGTIIALGAFILLSALWLALSFANHDSVVYNNLSWWIGGTAIFSMFVAGLIAGCELGSTGHRRRQRERPHDVGPSRNGRRAGGRAHVCHRPRTQFRDGQWAPLQDRLSDLLDRFLEPADRPGGRHAGRSGRRRRTSPGRRALP